MKIGVLGTGAVGHSIGTKLVQLGHDVRMGAREAKNEKAQGWAKAQGAKASSGTFADAASFGELVFNCTAGTAAIQALDQAGEKNLDRKVLIDISNPLDFSKGFPPTLFAGNTESLGEQIQRRFPKAKVVKTLNTINCELMVDPKRVADGDHTLFISGNDTEAKGRVLEIVRGWFGWKEVVDLGDITTARGTECYLPLWIRLMGALKTAHFNVKVMR